MASSPMKRSTQTQQNHPQDARPHRLPPSVAECAPAPIVILVAQIPRRVVPASNSFSNIQAPGKLVWATIKTTIAGHGESRLAIRGKEIEPLHHVVSRCPS